MTLQLRDYQEQGRDAVIAGWDCGKLAQLCVIPTGGGKTEVGLAVLAAEFASEPDARAVWVAHRNELVTQPMRRIDKHWTTLRDYGLVKAEFDDAQARLVFTTRQTFCRDRRRAAVLRHGLITHLVIDEAHHATAQQYRDIVDGLRAVNPDLRVLGLTATPKRADGDGLVSVFDAVAIKRNILDMVERGYLAVPRVLAIQTRVSLADVGTVGGDYNQGNLRDVFECDNVNELIVATHQQYAAGRKGMAFTVSVEGAYRLAEKFNEHGLRATAADGTTNDRIRDALLRDVYAGRYDVLVNCALWTEGFDWPEASVIHMARPTKSDGLYLQMMGRGLRAFPGKEDGLILDYVAADKRDMVLAGDVLGAPLTKSEYLRDDAEEGEAAGGFTYDQTGFNWLRGNPAEIIARALNYFAVRSPWSWHRGSDGWFSLGLGKGADDIERALVMSTPDAAGDIAVYLAWKRAAEWHWKAAEVQNGALEEARRWAEDYADRRGVAALASKSGAGKWADRSPSDAQLKFARRLGIRDAATLTRGKLADAITHKLALDAVRRNT